MSRFLAMDWVVGGVTGRYSVARRFLRETRSDTAVEFAMIGAAFFLFICGIFVISIDQFWQMTLDDAGRNATRQVQIGKVTTDAQFRTMVCNEFGVAAPYCGTILQYSVQENTSFGAMAAATLNSSGALVIPGTATPFPSSVLTMSASGAPEFLLVQVAYLLPFKILAAPGGVATENGTPALLSTVTTVMEP
jgi:hypothetical protein